MYRGGEAIRRVVGTLLATLTVVLSVALPVLERADLLPEPLAESQHDPGGCAPAHNHTLCTQAGAQAAFASASVRPLAGPRILSLAPAPMVAASVASAMDDGRSARGPPRI